MGYTWISVRINQSINPPKDLLFLHSSSQVVIVMRLATKTDRMLQGVLVTATATTTPLQTYDLACSNDEEPTIDVPPLPRSHVGRKGVEVQPDNNIVAATTPSRLRRAAAMAVRPDRFQHKRVSCHYWIPSRATAKN